MKRTRMCTVALAFFLIFGALSAHAEDTGVPLHGFADIGAGGSSTGTPSNQVVKGFNLGTLDIYLNPEFEDRVKSLLEVALEPNLQTGAEAIDVERLQVGYTFSDWLTVWGGRFHTPYGYWNNAFHHGAQLQTSIYRPRFIDFEDKGGLLPAHTVGLWATGNVNTSSIRVPYSLYFGNGPRITSDGGVLAAGSPLAVNGGFSSLDPNLVRNDKDRYMIGGELALAPKGALDGFMLGVHGFSTTVDAYNASSVMLSATQVNMLGAYAVYDNHGLEAVGEYYSFNDTDLANSGATGKVSNMGFAQVGYMVVDNVRPFFRYESATMDMTDNYFASQSNAGNYTRYSVGARYDVNPRAALKFEVMNTNPANGSVYTVEQAQYAIRF